MPMWGCWESFLSLREAFRSSCLPSSSLRRRRSSWRSCKQTFSIHLNTILKDLFPVFCTIYQRKSVVFPCILNSSGVIFNIKNTRERNVLLFHCNNETIFFFFFHVLGAVVSSPAVQIDAAVVFDSPALLDNPQPFPGAAALPSALRLLLGLLLLPRRQHGRLDGK